MGDVTADLADTIRALRQQLTRAMQDGQQDSLRFELGDITVELEVTVSRDATADGGVRFGVVSFGAEGSLSDEVTHRIELTLRPVLRRGERSEPALVRDTSGSGREPR